MKNEDEDRFTQRRGAKPGLATNGREWTQMKTKAEYMFTMKDLKEMKNTINHGCTQFVRRRRGWTQIEVNWKSQTKIFSLSIFNSVLFFILVKTDVFMWLPKSTCQHALIFLQRIIAAERRIGTGKRTGCAEQFQTAGFECRRINIETQGVIRIVPARQRCLDVIGSRCQRLSDTIDSITGFYWRCQLSVFAVVKI